MLYGGNIQIKGIDGMTDFERLTELRLELMQLKAQSPLILFTGITIGLVTGLILGCLIGVFLI